MLKKIILLLGLLLICLQFFAQNNFIRDPQNRTSNDSLNFSAIRQNQSQLNLSQDSRTSSGVNSSVILILLIIAFIFIIILMIIQFKLRTELKLIEEQEEKKYRYKSRNLLKSLEEQTRELNRLRRISSTYQKLQISFDELQKSKSRLDLLKQAIIAIKHPVTITNLNGKVIFCNQEMANLLQIPSSEILGKNLPDFFNSENSDIPTLENLKQWRGKEFYLRLKGEGEKAKQLMAKPELLRDSENNPLAVVISFIRIDDVHIPEEKTEYLTPEPNKDQSNLDIIINQLKDVYFEMDENGWIREISPSVEKLIHLPKEQIIGKKLGFICTNLEDEEILLKVIKQQKEVDNYDLTLAGPDGFFVSCSLSAKLVEDLRTNEIRIVGSIRDVTERKLDEEKRLKALRKLKQINKDLLDFAYIVSHDLKSPLRAINTLANWILMDKENKFTEESIKNLNLLLKRTERMHHLIDAIFDYINIINVDTEKVLVDVNKVIKNITYKIDIPAHIKLQIKEELPQIVFERTRIEQIFEHLIENSIKFMDKQRGLIKIEFLDKETEWQFTVADNGPGIEEKYFSKVFQIFQTLDSSEDKEGTGIGLAIVKKIIDKYEGKIWLVSEPGNGLQVNFTIPKLKLK